MKRFTLVSSTRGVNWRWGVKLISRVWEKENLACKPRRSRRVSSSATSRTGVRKNEGAAAPPSASRRLNYPVKKKKKKSGSGKKKKKTIFFRDAIFFAAESSVTHPGRTGAAKTGVKTISGFDSDRATRGDKETKAIYYRRGGGAGRIGAAKSRGFNAGAIAAEACSSGRRRR